jgi:hypothetical protein
MYGPVHSPADMLGSDKDARWSRYRAQGIGVLCQTLTACCVSTGRCMGFTPDRTAALPTSFFAVPIAFSSRWAPTGSTPGPKHVRSDEWQRLTGRDNPRADAN